MALVPYFRTFQALTDTTFYDRTFGQAYYSMLYSDGDPPFTGDMSIEIENGPSIRIPNSQLVVPECTIADDGQLVANYSRSNLVINVLQDTTSDDMSRLGRQFLSGADVMLNQDTHKYTLWSANPTSAVDLVGIDSKGNEVTSFCSAADSSAGTSDGAAPKDNTSSSSGASDTSTSSLSGGTIAGVALVAGLAGWLWRRKQAGPAPVELADQPAGGPDNQSAYTGYTDYTDYTDYSATSPGDSYLKSVGSPPISELNGSDEAKRNELPVEGAEIQPLAELPHSNVQRYELA